MALQLFKIADSTVESPVTSVTFSNIPSGYTDLILKASPRNTSTENAWKIRLNNDSSGAYSVRLLLGTGAAASSSSASGQSAAFVGRMSMSSDTANTFGSVDIYIPNYTSSNNKSISSDVVTENNATTAYQSLFASLWSNTSAITTITCLPDANSFTTGSTFTLYGVL